MHARRHHQGELHIIIYTCFWTLSMRKHAYFIALEAEAVMQLRSQHSSKNVEAHRA